MKKIEEIIRNTTEEEQEKLDWTKAWSTKYPVLEFTFPIDQEKKAYDMLHSLIKTTRNFIHTEKWCWSSTPAPTLSTV